MNILRAFLFSFAEDLLKFKIMSDESEVKNLRFTGMVDHLALKCADLESSVEEYKRLGFRTETIYEDWAMMRDTKGFGIALLPPESKHPPHIGLKVETLEELEKAAAEENRPIKPHRDGTSSFYTKGIDGNIVELIYYPPDFNG